MHDDHAPSLPTAEHTTTGPSRRSLIVGAAWSIPAVALATATPAFAGSNDVTLAFDKSSYDTTSCGAITGAFVTASENNVPAAGVVVTVSLSGSYTFSDGSVSSTGVTDGSGRYDIPAIYVPDRGGSGSVVATEGSSSAQAAASLSAPAVTKFAVTGIDYSGDYNSLDDVSNNVPAGSTPQVGDWYLSPDDQVISSQGRGLKSNVAKMGPGIRGTFGYVNTDGTFGWTQPNDDMGLTSPGIPTGAEPVGGDWFLADDGRIFDHTAAVVATGVSKVGPANNIGVGVVLTSGELGYFDYNGQYQTASAAVPPGSIPASGAWFLTPDKQIIRGDTGVVVATDVETVGPPIQDLFGLVLSSGAYAYFDANGTYHAVGAGIPAGCVPVGRDWFLARDGRLFDGSGSVKFSGIGQVAKQRGQTSPVGFALKPGC